MAVAPFKINDRRGRNHQAGGNSLYSAATQTAKRRPMPRLDRDYHRNVSDYGWRELLSAARYICGRFGPVRGAIRQMATYAIGNAFAVQYYGRNKAWGEAMEAQMEEWDKVCDVRGPNVDFRTGLVLDLMSIIRDGDTLTLLTEGESGWPMVQSIPAHRIGKTYGMQEDVGNGFSLVNGCVVNSYGRTVGFRVYNDDSLISDSYRELSARDAALHYSLDYHEQVRGVTWLAPVIEDVADLYDIRSFLKTALKAESSIALIEENEMGGPPPVSAGMQLVGMDGTDNLTHPDDSNTVDGSISTEKLEEGAYLYFRSQTGGRISAPNTNRPGQDSQKFYFEILRGSFEALGWPIEFYDPSALGGANIRMRVAQGKRTVEQLQLMAKRIAVRKHRYAVAKMIKLGILPFDEDWWMLDHQTPRDLTVDNGRDTKADIELYKTGAISLEDLCGRMGSYWEDVQDAKIREEKRLQERCAAEGVDPNRIMAGNGNSADKPEDEAKDAKEGKKGDDENADG